MLFAITDTPPNPVYIASELRWSEPVARLVLTPYAFMPAYDCTRCAYLLERNSDPGARAAVARAITTEADLVGTEETGASFDHDSLAPLTTPDRPLPRLCPRPSPIGSAACDA